MAPFLRESWRPNSFLVKLNSVAGGVSSASGPKKPSEVHFRPRETGLAPTESQSIGASETNSATQSSDATSTEQSATASTEVNSTSTPSATPVTSESVQVTPSASDPLPSATQNTFVVEPSSSSIPVSSNSSTDELPSTAAPSQVPSSAAPKPPVKPTTSAAPSASPTVIAPSPPPATPTQGTPNPGNGSPNSVPPAPVPSPNLTASEPSAVTQVPSPSGPAVISPVATTSAASGATTSSPESAPSPSQEQDGGQVLPTVSQPLSSVAVPSSATLVISSTPSEISPAITPVPTSVAIRVGGGSVIDGTTFTDSSITQVITTTAASVVTSDGRTFTTSVAVESTRVLSTRVPVPTTENASLGDSNSQRTKAIVGGAIGGAIIFLSLAILAWILCYRRRRAQELKLLEASVFAPDNYSPPPNRAVSVSSFKTTTTVTPRAVSPSLSEKSYSSRPGFNVTSQRPLYLEDPLRHVRDRGNLFDVQSYQVLPPGFSSRSNPAHVQPLATTRNPFADPIHTLPNPFDDPIAPVKGSSTSNGHVQTSKRVPSVVISPATPMVSTMRHSATSSVDSGKKSISSGEYGMAM